MRQTLRQQAVCYWLQLKIAAVSPFDAFLGIVAPQLLAPFPSATIVQFDLDPEWSREREGLPVPRHTLLQTRPVDGVRCRFASRPPLLPYASSSCSTASCARTAWRLAAGSMKGESLLMNQREGSGYGVVLLGGITSGSSWLFSVGASGMVVGR